jgi:hypothetical protein
VASLEAQIVAVLLPSGFHLRVCGRLCTALQPSQPGTLSVAWVKADGTSAGDSGPREVGVFGAFRADYHRWQVAVVTADETWFHGEYTDARLLRQRRGDPPEPLRSVLTAELIVLQ